MLSCPLYGSASIWPAGTAWSPIRGCVGLDARLSAGYQAGTASVPPPTNACARVGPMQYRPPTGSIPDAPGSYQFYDAEGRVLYVGKAKSLRHRLPNYWQDSVKLPPAPPSGPCADHVEWIVVDTEVD